MAQIFHPVANALSRASIFGGLFVLGGLAFVGVEYFRSPFTTYVNVVREQPVQFSHQHHVQGLGIDCRYCHNSVEVSGYANVPPTYTCMSCHSQIWGDSPMLAPVRESLREDKPIRWTRVHNLPDFVYFNHGVHVSKGIGCVSCHGRIDQMPLTWQEAPLTMEWCLSCHRAPEKHIRPREQIFNMTWSAEKDEGVDQLTLGRELVQKYQVETHGASDGRTNQLTNCSTCHR